MYLNKIAPDRPHREESASLVILILDLEERAFTDVVVISWEDPFLRVTLFTALFVFTISTLEVVVAEKLLLQTNLPPSIRPIPGGADQVSLLLAVSTTWRLVDFVTFATETQ